MNIDRLSYNILKISSILALSIITALMHNDSPIKILSPISYSTLALLALGGALVVVGILGVMRKKITLSTNSKFVFIHNYTGQGAVKISYFILCLGLFELFLVFSSLENTIIKYLLSAAVSLLPFLYGLECLEKKKVPWPVKIETAEDRQAFSGENAQKYGVSFIAYGSVLIFITLDLQKVINKFLF